MIKISKDESKSKCKSGEERGREKKWGEFVNVNAAELVKEESWKSGFLFFFDFRP